MVNASTQTSEDRTVAKLQKELLHLRTKYEKLESAMTVDCGVPNVAALSGFNYLLQKSSNDVSLDRDLFPQPLQRTTEEPPYLPYWNRALEEAKMEYNSRYSK